MRSAIALSIALAACGASPEARHGPLVVAAASSLTEVVPSIASQLDGVEIEFRFDASSTLARQIEAGAPCDVLLSADGAWADHVIEAGLADRADRVVFATNHLVVVVPAASTTRPTSLSDLATYEHVAIASAEVPAGRLARAALEHEHLRAALEARLVQAPNVRAALAWVTRGEADVAIVYATDARVEPSVVVAFEIGAEIVPPALDVAVALHGVHHDRARAFVDALRSPSSQAILVSAGFGAAP